MLFCIIVCWHGIHTRQRLLFGRRTSEEGSGIGLTSVEETSEYMGTMIHLPRAWPLLQGPPLSTGRKVGRKILSSNLLIQLLLNSVPLLHTRIQKYCPLSQERGNNKGLMYFFKVFLYLFKFFINEKGTLYLPTCMCRSINFFITSD